MKISSRMHPVSQPEPKPQPFHLASIAVFVATAIVMFLVTADIFYPSMDEGIYLEGASRLLAGQVPYKDFFAYTGPVVYWVGAALEALFGRDLTLLRLSVCFALGLTTAGLFGMTSLFRGWRAGLVATRIFFGFTIYSIYRFPIGHRWLSTGFFTLAAMLALYAAAALGSRRTQRMWAFASGAAAALAAWTTPTYAAALLLTAGWFDGSSCGGGSGSTSYPSLWDSSSSPCPRSFGCCAPRRCSPCLIRCCGPPATTAWRIVSLTATTPASLSSFPPHPAISS